MMRRNVERCAPFLILKIQVTVAALCYGYNELPRDCHVATFHRVVERCSSIPILNMDATAGKNKLLRDGCMPF